MMGEVDQRRRGGGGGAAADQAAAEHADQLPGFRFHPTEEELLEFYLRQAAQGRKLRFDIIPTVHLYRHDPWELPGLARIGEREWYFFVPRDRKQQGGAGSGGRPSRTTERGFWKATGSDRAVRCAADPKRLIGLKKTLVYYEGRAPRGTKTDWVMNEYRLPDHHAAGNGNAAAGDSSSPSSNSTPKEDMVLCKIYRKAVSLKELEQRVAMEELARATASTATPSASHSTGSPADSTMSSSTDHQEAAQQHHQGETTTLMMMPIVPAATMKKEAEVMVESMAAAPALVRPATLSLPQLDVQAKQQQQQQEWMQDPFLTQLRSPWMESWSPYYASVLNF